VKIFIFGSTGMLGTYVTKYFSTKGYEVVPVSRKNIDISKVTDSILMNSTISRGDVVINCAGLIKQRAGTTEYDFIKINSMFPHMLSMMCETKGAKLIHISTDCVFDGVWGGYNENDEHNATDIYGRSKSLGEPSDATVIRTSIIGEEKTNFLSLLEWVKANKDSTVNGFTNHYWNGITCLKFAEVCEHIIKNNLFWSSVKHIFSPNIFSKYELVKMISDVYDLNINVIPVECQNKCDRSLTTIRRSIIIPIEDLETQLHIMKEFKIKE
jgi:dTDP-4-dehydrorhamnose reductase